jgi:tRNA(Ile)-lysidine synthase
MRPNPRDRTLEFSADRLIGAERLLPAEGPILVAVSGGPDSVALWHFLAAYAGRGKPAPPVVAAHVNHGLRGPESDEDARFVRALAEKWGRPLVERRLGPLSAPSEEAARLARYAALKELAAEVGADRVFTAHTADDQAETVLLRLVRGAGLRGLAGMPVRGSVKGVRVVRPLLRATREEVLDYIRRHDLPYRIDSTNHSSEAIRNFLRLEILPRIRQRMNASAREAILRAADAVREAEEYLSAESRRLLPSLARRDGQGKISLDAAALLDYPKLLRSYLFRDAVQELNGDVRNLASAHIDALLSLVTPPSRRSVDLPGGIRAWRERGRVHLELRALRIPESAGRAAPSNTEELRRPCR